MTGWFESLRDRWRRRVDGYSIDDPRPVARDAPYTFFLPSEDQLRALRPGDHAKLIFRSHPPGKNWDAERMWVTVTQVEGDRLAGTLNNEPYDIPRLKPGTRLAFRRSDVIDLEWAEDRSSVPPAPERRHYWDRCRVDDCVLQGRSPVDYLYRETPGTAGPDDPYPDSGWRIHGSEAGIADDAAAGRSPHYLALGAVLNRDDAWLPLIDAPIGSAFRLRPDSGFAAVDRQSQG